MKSRRLEELAALRSSIERLVPAAEIAYLTLREAIYREILPGGEPLHEADLATALQVSRTPVREALARLLAEGLEVFGQLRAGAVLLEGQLGVAVKIAAHGDHTWSKLGETLGQVHEQSLS